LKRGRRGEDGQQCNIQLISLLENTKDLDAVAVWYPAVRAAAEGLHSSKWEALRKSNSLRSEIMSLIVFKEDKFDVW
jgi:hypothetical protein